MNIMYDAVNAENIPATASAVAGYVDGPYQWHPEDWDRFPSALHVGICITPAHDLGEVLDVEPGDSTPQHAVNWAQMRRKHGISPAVYCSKAAWAFVRQAFNEAKEAQPSYWVAEWNGVPSLESGESAHQYKSMPGYDLSVISDNWIKELSAPTMAAPTAQNNRAPAKTVSLSYVVKAGDTLSQIAERYKVTLQSIVAANGIKDANRIYVGQIIRIYGSTAGPSTAPDKPIQQYTLMQGSRIFYSGHVYADSYGNGQGAEVSGNFVVDRYIQGRKFGAHIPQGWVPVGPIHLL